MFVQSNCVSEHAFKKKEIFAGKNEPVKKRQEFMRVLSREEYLVVHVRHKFSDR